MAGTAQPPRPMVSLSSPTPGSQRKAAAAMNAYRFASVVDRLAKVIASVNLFDRAEFINLLLSLSRSIDYAVANYDRVPKAKELPLLLQQICKLGGDPNLQAAVMVLMISVKNACKVGWFAEETQQILTLANEMGSKFCTSVDFNIEDSYLHTTISKIMERFYPRMKMGSVLASLDIKSGYGAYMIDFHILKQTEHSPLEKIQLLVAQVDNMETSACIISPQQVNFLVNGKGVARRTTILPDTGPQLPTNVTSMLKYGTNIVQAIGQFNGHFIIVIAFMCWRSLCEIPDLQDYVQPLVAGSNSDPDIIEGPSRVSLNCPISHSRIKTPVKGHSCKHLQCFDFHNYVDINSRRPSWRCPHCNHSVCYTDIRVDQDMVKVLKDVDKDVADVIISTDGSWKAVFENDDHLEQARDTDPNRMEERSERQECVLDLTEDDDDEMDTVGTFGVEDRKPTRANPSTPSDFWTGLYFNSFLGGPASRSDTLVFSGAPQPTPATFVQAANASVSTPAAFVLAANTSVSTPATFVQAANASVSTPAAFVQAANTSVITPATDAVSPAFNREFDARVNTSVTASETYYPHPTIHNLQLQQMNMENLEVGNDFARTAENIPRMVIRVPNAVQALPAQSQAQAPGSLQRLRTNLSPLTPASAVTSQASLSPTENSFNRIYSDRERRRHFSRSISPLQGANVSSSSLQPGPTAQQNQNHQEHPFFSQRSSAQRSSYGLSEFQNSHLQSTFNPRMSQPIGQSSNVARSSSSSHIPWPGTASQQFRSTIAESLAGRQMARQSPLMPPPSQTVRQGTSLPSADGLVDSPSDWRPAGRMRGSLSGSAYSQALNQFMMNNQTVHPSRQLPVPVPVPPGFSPLPDPHVATDRNAHGSQTQNTTNPQ